MVTLFTLGLGVVVYVTSQQLATTELVAPSVPEVEPEAAEPACTLAFNINPTTTPTSTPTNTPTSTPTGTPTATPTPTPTGTQEIVYVYPTPTPVQIMSCNSSCTINTDCPSDLVCVDGSCRNPSCTGATTCVCTQTPQPTPKTPVSGGPSVLGATVIGMGVLILLVGLAL